MGSIDPNNSYLFPLNVGDSFGGVYTSTIDYSEILISVECDSTYRLVVNFSSNGTDFGISQEFDNNLVNISAKTYSLKPLLRYYQVNLINTDINNQTYLRLESLLKNVGVNVGESNVANQQIFNDSTGINGVSDTISSSLITSNYTFFGNVDGATDLVVQCSADSTNFYDTQYVYTSSGAGNFGFNVVLCAEYLRLKSTNDVNCVCFVNSG